MPSLQSEDLRSLVDAVERTGAVLLGLAAAARAAGLVELPVLLRLELKARYAFVTLAGRTEAPVMAMFRRFAAALLRD